jgi:protein Mpv17
MSAVIALSHAFINQPKRLWSKYLKILDAKPVQTKIGTSVAAAFLGDMIAQSLSPRKDDSFKPDFARTARLCVFNGGMGLFGHFYFAALDRGVKVGAAASASTSILKGPAHFVNSISKTFIDQGIFAPLATMMFYLFKVSSEGRPSEFIDELKSKYVHTLIAGWKLWPAAHMVNFMFIPPQHRVLYTNFVSVAGTYVLSKAAAGEHSSDETKRSKYVRKEAEISTERPNEVLFDFGAVKID